MRYSPLSKVVLAAALAAVLTVPALSAAPRRVPAASSAGASFSFTDAILRFLGSVTGLLKEGASIDPSGRSGSLASAVAPYEGCGVDPNGRPCVTSGKARATQDVGCGVDPNGRCIPPVRVLATQDAGCGIDPSGHCVTGH
jgi:hypothetical protein